MNILPVTGFYSGVPVLGPPLSTKIHSPGEILSIAFCPDGSLLFTGKDRLISIWEVPD